MEIVNQEAWTIGEVMKVAQAMEDSGVSVFAVLPNQEEPRQYFVLGNMSNTFWSLCRELTDHLALQDEPPHELVNRAQYFLSKYGCWLDEGQQNLPDTCVLDTGDPQDCWHAERLVKEGKDKCNCQYWNTCHPI
jgi:hypothetical protein